MLIRRGALAAAAAFLMVLGACGDDDAAEDADPPTEEAADSGGGEGETLPGEDDPTVDSDLPDPCSLFDEEELTEAFGAPGEGTHASVDARRRVCTYAGGTIIGVATTNQFDPSVAAAQAAGAACTDAEEVGDQASFCTTFGQVGQLLWVEGDVFYDLTAASVERDAFTELARDL